MKKLLPEVCTIQYGFPFDSAKFSDSNGMPLIRIRDVVRGYSETYTTEEYKSEYIVHENDLLIGMDGEFNIAKWGKTPALLNQRVCRLAPKDSIDKDYLFYFMPIALKRVEEKTPFVTVKHLSAKELNKIEIPVLPLEEQRKIAETLSKVDELIAFRDQQVAKLDELVKARFVEMFGDPVTNPKGYEKYKLENLARKISDGVHSKPDYTETGRPFLSVVNINKGVINFKNCKYVSEDAYQKMIKSTHPERGDVLYTKVGATYGIPAYVDTDIAFCLYVSVCLIKPKREVINPRFLSLSMEMPYVKHQADRRIKGIGVPDLHLNQISEFEILCPPLKEQDIFIYFVERLDEEKRVVQQSLEKLELMKKALMQEYFG